MSEEITAQTAQSSADEVSKQAEPDHRWEIMGLIAGAGELGNKAAEIDAWMPIPSEEDQTRFDDVLNDELWNTGSPLGKSVNEKISSLLKAHYLMRDILSLFSAKQVVFGSGKLLALVESLALKAIGAEQVRIETRKITEKEALAETKRIVRGQLKKTRTGCLGYYRYVDASSALEHAPNSMSLIGKGRGKTLNNAGVPIRNIVGTVMSRKIVTREYTTYTPRGLIVIIPGTIVWIGLNVVPVAASLALVQPELQLLRWRMNSGRTKRGITRTAYRAVVPEGVRTVVDEKVDKAKTRVIPEIQDLVKMPECPIDVSRTTFIGQCTSALVSGMNMSQMPAGLIESGGNVTEMKAILAAYAVGLRHGAELRGFMCMERGRGRIKGGMQRTALLQSQNVVDALAQMIQFRDLLRGGVDERGVSVCNNGIDRIMLKAVADARAIQRPQGDTKIPLPSESVTNAINVIYNSQHEKILRSRGKYEETPSELA